MSVLQPTEAAHQKTSKRNPVGQSKSSRPTDLKIEFASATESNAIIDGASKYVPTAKLTNISKHHVRVWDGGSRAYSNLKVEIMDNKGYAQVLNPIPPAFVPDFHGIRDLAPGKTYVSRFPVSLDGINAKKHRLIYEIPRDRDAIASNIWTGKILTPYRTLVE